MSDEIQNAKRIVNRDETPSQQLEPSPSETANKVRSRAVTSFHEHIYEDLTEIKTKIVNLETKVNIIDESGVKAGELLNLVGSIEGVNSRLDNVAMQVADVDQHAKVR